MKHILGKHQTRSDTSEIVGKHWMQRVKLNVNIRCNYKLVANSMFEEYQI